MSELSGTTTYRTHYQSQFLSAAASYTAFHHHTNLSSSTCQQASISRTLSPNGRSPGVLTLTTTPSPPSPLLGRATSVLSVSVPKRLSTNATLVSRTRIDDRSREPTAYFPPTQVCSPPLPSPNFQQVCTSSQLMIGRSSDPEFTEHYRVGCDVMNLFFVFDEHTDVAPGDTVRMLADISMDAMRNPHKPRPVTEPVLGEITRQ